MRSLGLFGGCYRAHGPAAAGPPCSAARPGSAKRRRSLPPPPEPPALSCLARPGLPGFDLKGLPDAAAHEVLALRPDRPSDAARARILAQAHGNPLALLELPAVSGFEALGDELVPELPARLIEAFHVQIESLP